MAEINERWKAAREQLRKTQTDFSKALGIPRKELSEYEKDSKIPLSSIRLLHLTYDVREDYILHGDLPVLETAEYKTAQLAKIVPQTDLPDWWKDSISKYAKESLRNQQKQDSTPFDRELMKKELHLSEEMMVAFESWDSLPAHDKNEILQAMEAFSIGMTGGAAAKLFMFTLLIHIYSK